MLYGGATQLIAPGLKPTECYVDAYLRADPGKRGRHAHELGPTTTFVSHAHDAPVVQLIGTLAEMELKAAKQEQQAYRAFYWIDFFCQSEFSAGV